LLTEWELRAVADATLKLHGARAPLFVATRIGSLAAEGDADGVAAWQAIARRMGTLSVLPPRDSDD
jgi:hypothetical protein